MLRLGRKAVQPVAFLCNRNLRLDREGVYQLLGPTPLYRPHEKLCSSEHNVHLLMAKITRVKESSSCKVKQSTFRNMKLKTTHALLIWPLVHMDYDMAFYHFLLFLAASMPLDQILGNCHRNGKRYVPGNMIIGLFLLNFISLLQNSFSTKAVRCFFHAVFPNDSLKLGKCNAFIQIPIQVWAT